jgi:conjugative relaxase-like TrwC/TraI family protein
MAGRVAYFRPVDEGALRYHGRFEYFSGESPLRWQGGRRGDVTEADYWAAFRSDRKNGRAGFELVVTSGKEVSLLGVIGREGDMAAIVDAELRATMAYLDGWAQREGARRVVGGRREAVATSGLTWCETAHHTSRADDPHEHRHVLVVNHVRLDDGKMRSLNSGAFRSAVDRATVYGREQARQTAEALGYATQPEPGLRVWSLSGFPANVLDVQSKRSRQIGTQAPETGWDSYRSRSVAARATRTAKTGATPEQLLPRWRDELAAIGWPIERLAKSIDDAARKEREHARLRDLQDSRHRLEGRDQSSSRRPAAGPEGQSSETVSTAAGRYRARVPSRE